MIILDQPAAVYHAAPHIGSTTAKLLLTSPRLFADRMAGLDIDDDKPCFQIGRLAHQMVLEPDKFAECVVSEGPINEKTGKPYGRDTQAFARWQIENPNLTYVEPWLHTAIIRMPDEVGYIFKEGLAESSVYQEDSNGVKIKCRPDYLRGGTITDLKTIETVDQCDLEIDRRRYWLSHAWYRRVMQLESGKDHKFQFVFMEKRPPFRWRIRTLSQDYIDHADAEIDNVLETIHLCTQRNDWTDYSDINAETQLPARLANEAFEINADGQISL
jgi:hypothetical protein